jgi:putative membrane protein
MPLPALNAGLNLLSALLLSAGFVMIRRGRVEWHRRLMVAAFATSTLFLVSYLAYHLQAGHVRYLGQGGMRTVYFAILVSHSVLAMVIVPMALRTLFLALRGRFEAHRRLARWALPLWIYVSVTGVVIYEMLY